VSRGILSRPTVKQIYAYRQYVDAHIQEYIHHLSDEMMTSKMGTFSLGLNHEQQHQELLLMDIKHNFSLDPSFPSYRHHSQSLKNATIPLEFCTNEGGIIKTGNDQQEFCFDNELPRHDVIVRPYQIANRLITNGEYLEFINAGGYKKPDWWLTDGWDCVQRNQWRAPLYWYGMSDHWSIFTLSGMLELNLEEPVSHISYYEADAFARWKNKRLPTEAEWENYVCSNHFKPHRGHFLEKNVLHPLSVKKEIPHEQQFFGDLWEWTASAYLPYPGYKPMTGALGEYNGKFMSNQFVLRGGSCITPQAHIRASYRNFFQPDKRWQFSGIRLANE